MNLPGKIGFTLATLVMVFGLGANPCAQAPGTIPGKQF